ncbi:MAG: hypothetical protein EP326_08385 [Deltaproteobacteria bacterium]|nr:MAG: hypothetical protein EP326_08385 [Deltaproteobacteria bacterium]
MREIIEEIVTEFYKKATSDFMIGYHFRKIATEKGENPLAPPIEAFADHIPRITTFWEIQLTGKTEQVYSPFDLITLHKQLSIRKGEVGRWVLLFKETLNDYKKSNEELVMKWETKISEFEKRFLESSILFP